MSIATVTSAGGRQAIELPHDIHVDAESVSVRREGDAIILEPIRAARWPVGFFESIRIDDPNWSRPEQGDLPATPLGKSPGDFPCVSPAIC